MVFNQRGEIAQAVEDMGIYPLVRTTYEMNGSHPNYSGLRS